MSRARTLVTVLGIEDAWRGALTAPTPTVGPTELLTDPGLETWDSATVPHTPWAVAKAGTSTVNREGTTIHGGTYAGREDIDASNNYANLAQPITAGIGTWLLISAWNKASVGSKTVRLANSGATALQPNGATQSSPTNYAQLVQTARLTGANPSLSFIRGSAASSSLYFDDCSAKALTQTTLYTLRKMAQVNGVFTCQPTRTVGTQAGIIHYADATNFVIIYLDGQGNLVVEKLVGGTWQAAVSTTAVTYSAAATLQVQRSGGAGAGSYVVTYNGSAVGGANSITDAVFDSAHYWGVFSTYASNSFGSCSWAGPH